MEILKHIYTLFITFFIPLAAILQQPEVVVNLGHQASVSCTDISSDGKWIVTGGGDNIFLVSDFNSKRLFYQSKAFDFRVSKVQFNQQSSIVGVSIEGGGLEFVDFLTGESVSRCEVEEYVGNFHFIENKNQVVYTIGSEIVLFDYITNKELKRFTLPTNILEHPTYFIWEFEGNKINKNIIYLVVTDNTSSESKKFELVTVDVVSQKILKSLELKDVSKLCQKRGGYVDLKMSAGVDDDYLAIASDGSRNGFEGHVYIVDCQKNSLLFSKQVSDIRLSSVLVLSKHQQFLTFDQYGLGLWDIKSGKNIVNKLQSFVGVDKSRSGVDPNETTVLFGGLKTSHLFDLGTHKINTIPNVISTISSTAYDQVGKYYCTASNYNRISVWNLELNKVVANYKGRSIVALAPKNNDIFFINGLNIDMHSIGSPEKTKTFDVQGGLIQALCVSKDETKLIGSTMMGEVMVWDISTGKLVLKTKGNIIGIIKCAVHPSGKYVAVGGSSPDVYVYDIEANVTVAHFVMPIGIVSCLKFNDSGTQLAIGEFRDVHIYNTDDWSFSQKLVGEGNVIYSLDFFPDGKYMVTSSGTNPTLPADNNLYIWNLKSGKVKCKMEGHKSSLISAIVDRTSSHIYTSDHSGITKVWDSNTCTLIASMITVNESELVIYTPDNYYMSSKRALQQISLKLNQKLYSFEQFDLKLNRPDIVCERLNKSSQNIINAYRYFYKKRLKKSGFIEDSLDSGFHLPELQMNTRDIPVTTNSSKVIFPVRLDDSKYELDRLLVSVNGVPINGGLGIDLKKYKSKSIEYDVEIDLADGDNKIQVSVMNSKGSESYRETIRMVANFKEEKGNLYLVCIGIDSYQDANFNLNYAAKDARDIYKVMGSKIDEFNKIDSTILLNESATKENILAIKNKLAEATPSDMVVIFIAGHGLLDENLDYFFATHNVDFNNPSQEGVSYEMLEILLSECVAYRKLLLMDTCHSGELDKEEVEEVKNAQTKVGDVTFRAVGVDVALKEGFGVANTQLVLEEVFSDVGTGTGATVISSAGGAEYAIESKQEKNGLFTSAVVAFLSQENEHGVKAGTASVSELRDFVYKEVVEKSNNAQRPTARSENISNDFRIR